MHIVPGAPANGYSPQKPQKQKLFLSDVVGTVSYINKYMHCLTFKIRINKYLFTNSIILFIGK